MHAWVESEPAVATMVRREWINILQKLSLVFEHASIREAGAVLQSRYVATEHARSTSRQTAHKYITVVTLLVVLHDRPRVLSVSL